MTSLRTLLLLASAYTSTAAVSSVWSLHAAMSAPGMADPSLGVLSSANFDSVHHLVPHNTQPVVFEDAAHLLDAVLDGSVHAGLVSGIPPPSDATTAFSSTIVSPRAMFVRENSTGLRLALDAAIVRALHAGADVRAAQDNAPFEYVSVHTCRTNEVERFPFPRADTKGTALGEARVRGHVRIAALGPYNWGKDGDYTAPEPVGFWPDYYAAVEEAFRAAVGVGFERVYFASSDAAMEAIRLGEADATEPYWTVDAYHQGRPRVHAFRHTCTTLGYDSTFFVRTQKAPGPPSCAGNCGGGGGDGLADTKCYCDEACADHGDCCPDYAQECAPAAAAVTCAGQCGQKHASGCYCDHLCTENGDCCVDYLDAC